MTDKLEDRPSKKQRELLVFIDAFIAQHGYGPSYREVMHALNYRSVSTVSVHIDNLIKKGHLRKRDKSARSLEVCDSAITKSSTPAKIVIAKTQEKWLIDQVSARMADAEKTAKTVAELDPLYVLVGALHVLGLADAARAQQGKLLALKRQLDVASSKGS